MSHNAISSKKSRPAKHEVDCVAAALLRSGSFNVCYLNNSYAERAARRLARTAIRALKGTKR